MHARRKAAGAWFLVFVISGLMGCGKEGPRPETAAAFTPDVRFDGEVELFDFEPVERAIASMKAGSERDYYEGVLENRNGQYAASIPLLKRVLPGLRSAWPSDAATALEALGYDESQMGRYADAARDDSDLLEHFGSRLNKTKHQGIADDLGVWKVLAGSPPQTVTGAGPVRLKTERNPLGDRDAELSVHGIQGPWLLDTGANQSVVSESFARRLGLRLLPGVAETQSGITGMENPIHLAVLDELHLGGMVVRNIALLVLPDASLRFQFPGTNFQIHAILGFPVLQALGSVTFTRDGELIAGALPKALPGSARMFMGGASPLLEASVDGRQAMFLLDTGASGSDLSARFYKDFPEMHASLEKKWNITAEAGGNKRQRLYVLPSFTLRVGGQAATLHHVVVHTEDAGTVFNQLYGNLGQNLWAGADSFTMDFGHMRFSLNGPRALKVAVKE